MRLTARFRFLSLAFAAAALYAPAALFAQDTRTVNEPTFPTTCTMLAAQQAIVPASGTKAAEPTSETTFDTTRIQAALTSCGSGKAVELVASGTNNAFLIAPLSIPNGVTLLVDAGVTVFGSRNPADYQVTGAEVCGTVGTAGNGCSPLINVNNGSTSTGSGIMGFGIINGRGGDTLIVNGVTQTYSWWDLANQANGNGAQNNPILLYAKKAGNFTLYKITLLNSPMFHVKYQSGTGFTVWGIKIVAPYTARNTDGIDPDDSDNNITITNSYLSDGDDMIALGATAGNPVTNVSITNDHTYSGHGISIGSYTAGGISNVAVSNVNMAGNLSDTNAAGLKIKSSSDRGGNVTNVVYQNVCIQNERYPLQFNPIYNTSTGTSIPYYTGIVLRNVTVAANAANNSQVQFQGLDAAHPLGLTLDNLNITGFFQVTPATHYVNFILGPGPVTPAQLQTLTGPGVTYTGQITNPTEARYACPATNFPFLAGELFLSTPTLTNQRTLSLPNPATFTLNAVVEPVEAASTAPTSSIQFYEGTTQVGTAALAGNGTLASVTLTGVASGAHTYTARYPADTAYAVLNFGSVTVNVNTTATTTSMTASTANAVFGNNVTLTATVTASAGTVAPTGTVSFQSGGTVLGTATLVAGTGTSSNATLTLANLPVGSNSIAAFYTGSTNFATSDSSATPVNVAITQAGSTTTVTATPKTAAFGSSITVTATVISNTSQTPTGTVTFMDGTTVLGTATLTGNTAVFTTTTLNTGSHTITAVYGGDANFTPSTSATGANVIIITSGTTTALGFSAASAPFGTTITMVASISAGGSSAAAATGTVNFYDGGSTSGTFLGSGQVSGGSATFGISTLALGQHSIVAAYLGDANYTASTSPATPLTITQAGTTTTLSATSATPTFGTSDTFTATVTPSTSGTASGTVTFLDGGKSFGTGTLTNNVATFTTIGLSGGVHSITASYPGDGNFTGSTSAAFTVTVGTAATTTTVSANPSSFAYGTSTTLTAMVSSGAAGTMTGSVSFQEGGTVYGSGNVDGTGKATLVIPLLSGGTHAIFAVYTGDTNYSTSSSNTTTVTVSKVNTAATLAANPTAPSYGATTTLTATFTPSNTSGVVTFLDNNAVIGGPSIVNGVATLTTAPLNAGTHVFTINYGGDTNYNAAGTLASVTVTVAKASSTTSLAANPTTITFGASTTLTATVPAGATGTVMFLDGGKQIGGNINVSGGTATYSTTALTGGSHSLTAVYSGDGNFLTSTSTAVTVQVNPATTTITLTATPTTFAFGSSTTFTATLGSTAATTTVNFFDGTKQIGSGTVTNGVATYTTSTLTGGNHSITAMYIGDTNFAAVTSAAVNITVTLAPTTTTVTATPSSFTFGGQTTLTATLSTSAATGTVSFFDGGKPLGNAVGVVNGVASLVATQLAGGTHSITAVYSGDTNFATSTSAAITVTVSTAATTTSVVATPSTTTFGSNVTLTASILPNGTAQETGTVNFFDNGKLIGSGTVSSAFGAPTASFSTSALATGPHTITATYVGDGNFTSSTSTSVAVTINPVVSSINVTASPSTITFGASTTLTATVSPASAGGSVTFKDSVAGTSGPVTLVNGVATYVLSGLTGGTHSITATYSGDTNDQAATSAAITVTVTAAGTTSTLTATPTTIAFGASTTLTATVSNANATGSFTFFDGTKSLGSPSIANGIASLSVATLGVGPHSITAVYSGDSNYATSTTAAVTVTVTTASTTATISATPTNAPFGSTVTITVAIAPSAATGQVNFFDGGKQIGQGQLANGVATYSTSTLAAGTHTLSATYVGDSNYATSSTTTSASVVITVATSTVTASANPSTVSLGLPTTLSASVSPAAATGSITFRDSASGLSVGMGNLVNGSVSVSGVVLSPGGIHSITATYSGDTNVGGATSAAIPVNVTPAADSATLTVTPAGPVMFGTSLTLSTVTSTVFSIPPTGTVTYFDGAKQIGSAGVTASSVSIATLMPGTHALTAVYSGDSNYQPSTSPAVSVVVNQANSTTTLVATPSQVTPGQTFTLTATVAGTSTGTPTGSVTFSGPNNFSSGAIALVNGTASITQSQTPLGSYSYTATYSGDIDFTTSATTAATVVQVKQLSSTTTIVATPTSGTFGTGTYSVTATVVPSSQGPATGSVIFKDGITVLGMVTLTSSDVATLSNLTFTGGKHTIIAYYSGDPTFTSSDTSAAPAVITIATAPTNTSLSISPATSSFGTAVTFSSSVTNSTGTPATGTVSFVSAGNTFGPFTLTTSGTVSYTTSTLAVGSYSYTAVYSGDTNFSTSTSTASAVTVTKISQTITSSLSSGSAVYGTAPFVDSVSASSGLPVTLTVTGPATLSGSTITITGVGTITITANQAGNATTAAAPTVTVTITVTPAPLTVTAASVTIPYGSNIPALTGTLTGVVNGDNITASYTTTATNTSNPGTYPITATLNDPAGRLANYTITNTPGTLTISNSTQTITFPAVPGNVTYGVAPITLTATASSGLPITYNVTGPASVTGSTLSVTGAGTVTVTASQPGNAVYSAATPVTQTIVVAKATLTVTAANASRAQGQPNPIFTGTLTGVVNGDAITANYTTTATTSSPAGTYPITPTLVDPNNRLVNYNVTTNAGTLTVTITAQTITFPAIPTTATYGVAPITLAATASSNLPVTYTVTGPATVTGSTLTITGAGIVTVTATQPGNAAYSAATPVSQTITIAPAPLTVTVASATRAFGAANPTFTGTITGLVNGDNITATYSTTATQTSPAGTYPITATLVDPAGRLPNYTVTNIPGTLTVSASGTTTALTLSTTQTFAGGPVLLTATVASPAGLPAGTVTFLNGTSSLGSATLVNGVGTFTVNLGVGVYSITASFAAQGSFTGSVSAPQTLTVVAPVTLSLSPSSLSLAAGAGGTSTLSLSPATGFGGAVTLTCASPVSYITCGVTSPVTVTAGTAATATVSINVAAHVQLEYPHIGPRGAPSNLAYAALLPLGALFMIPLFRRRRTLLHSKLSRLLTLALFTLAMSFAITGCGSSSSSATPTLPPAGPQNVVITATANGASVTTTLVVTITN